jgi:hypothetical protein
MRHAIASQGLPIADPRQIRALSSSIRQDILDAVAAIGPCSVAELAAALGKPADGLYYHVRRLLDVRLLMEVPADANGRTELRLDVAHRSQSLAYRPASRANKAAVLGVVGSMLRSAERTFRRGFRPDVAVVEGPQRNLWAGRARGSLSASELAAVNALLDRLITLMRSGRRDRGGAASTDRSPYELTFVLAPANRESRD